MPIQYVSNMKILYFSIIGAATVAIIASITFFTLHNNQSPCTFCPEQHVSNQPLQTSMTSPSVTTIIIPKDSEEQRSDKNFEPQYLTVILGVNNTVSWINESDAGNEIDATTYNQPDPTFEKGPYSHGIILPGKSFNFTFTKPGEFQYHTQPHPWLQGSILVLPQSPENATQTVVLNDTTIPGPCETFGLPCPLNVDRTFTAQKFGSNVYIEKVTINRVDHYAIIHPLSLCEYPSGHGNPCTNPDDIELLRIAGAIILPFTPLNLSSG